MFMIFVERVVLSFFSALLVLSTWSSCKKSDPDWRNQSVELAIPEIEQTGELTATVHYAMRVQGNPLPEILEFGLIVTTDPEAPFFGMRYPSEKEPNLENYTLYLYNIEAEKDWYVRSYAITHRDTTLSDVTSFRSGKYYSEGAGVTDIEGNFYKTVIIGGQEWMAENLKSRTFCNGDTLRYATNTSMLPNAWGWDDVEPASVSWNFDANNDTLYGKYYSGQVGNDTRNICPCGWRIPIVEDFIVLLNHIGNNQYAGGKMKSLGVLENGTGLWKYPNALATNLSGLNILPAGMYWNQSLGFMYQHEQAKIMVIDQNQILSGTSREISFRVQSHRREVDIRNVNKSGVFVSIRCIRE